MSILRVQISRDGRKILEGDADAYTIVFSDRETGTDVIGIWGDGKDGAWIHYNISEEEPDHLVPYKED